MWARASNYFLDNLLSISFQAACQKMLMSPELLIWILRSRFLCCFCVFKGEIVVGQQLAVSLIGRKVVLSSALSPCWRRDNAQGSRAQFMLMPMCNPSVPPLFLAPRLTLVWEIWLYQDILEKLLKEMFFWADIICLENNETFQIIFCLGKGGNGRCQNSIGLFFCWLGAEFGCHPGELIINHQLQSWPLYLY